MYVNMSLVVLAVVVGGAVGTFQLVSWLSALSANTNLNAVKLGEVPDHNSGRGGGYLSRTDGYGGRETSSYISILVCWEEGGGGRWRAAD